MSEVLELNIEEPKASVAEKRAAIETQLRENPQRSDREIARIVGCDHKTIGNVRGKLFPIPSPSVSPAACPPPPGIIDPPKEPEFDPFAQDCEDLAIPHQPAIS